MCTLSFKMQNMLLLIHDVCPDIYELKCVVCAVKDYALEMFRNIRNLFIMSKTLGFHSGDYEEPTFQRY
jgi:hypothetical protein